MFLSSPSHRRYSTGFYFGEDKKQYYESSSYIRNYDIIGIVQGYNEENGRAIIMQKNKIFEGDKVEILKPKGDNIIIALCDLKNNNDEKIESTPVAQMIYSISTNVVLQKGEMLIKGKEAK